MTWVQLDDGFDEHPKILGLSSDAFRLHVRAICYCNRRLTDGFVPMAFAPKKLAEELVSARCWEPVADGWTLHDYLDWNRSREQIEEERRKARERRQKGGVRSGEVRANNARRAPDVHEPTPLLSTTTPKSKIKPLATPSQNGEQPPRDIVFETIAEVCGIDWHELTPSARGSLNKAVAQLRDAHPPEIRRRAANWPYLFDADTTLTPSALAKHWPALSQRRTSVTEAKDAAHRAEMKAIWEGNG